MNTTATTVDPQARMDNDEPSHRAALIEALRAEGLDAYEYHSGGGLMHVVADLVNQEDGEDLLQIATGSVASPCDVALMGWNESGNVQNEDWIRTPSLRDAVTAFKRYHADRDTWIRRFHAGELDV